MPDNLRHIVFTDCHITEKSIPELEGVFLEILRYRKEAPVLVCVGDYYDKKNPNAKEIEFGTKWAKKFVDAFDGFYMITGNHPDIDGKISSVSYLEHLGVKIYTELELYGTYYGHFMVKESSGGFTETISVADLGKFKLSILGHQHSYQEIPCDFGKYCVIHPGSCRYCDFGEVNDKGKYILLVDDCTYKQIKLNKVRHMIEVTNVAQLRKAPREAMVRIVINSFAQFLAETDEIKELEKEFFEFKLKLNFTNTLASNVVVANSTDIISKWLDNIEDLTVKDEIIAELTSAGLC